MKSKFPVNVILLTDQIEVGKSSPIEPLEFLLQDHSINIAYNGKEYEFDRVVYNPHMDKLYHMYKPKPSTVPNKDIVVPELEITD
jgi:hypothetical protein